MVSIVSQDLNIIKHRLDDIFSPLQFRFDLIAAVFGIPRIEVIHLSCHVLDPILYIIQLGIGSLGFLMNLFGQALKLFEPRLGGQTVEINFTADL